MLIMSNENLVSAATSAKRHQSTLAISTTSYPLELLAKRVREVSQLGCDLFVAHGQGITLEMAFLDLVQRAQSIGPIPGIRLICTGGICADDVQNLFSFASIGLIVGRAVTTAGNPHEEILSIKSRLLDNLA